MVVRNKGWISSMVGQRSLIQKDKEKIAQPQQEPFGKPDARLNPDQANKLALVIPNKVSQKHQKALEGALDEAVGVARFGSNLGWRARGFNRVIQQFYNTVGKALDQAEEAIRPDIAKRAIQELQKLTMEIGDGDHLLPGVGAALGLFDLSTRFAAQGRTAPTDEQRIEAFPAAVATISTFIKEVGARPNASRLYNLFPVFLEQLERGLPPISENDRPALRDQVRRFLVETSPLGGCELNTSALLAQALTAALRQDPKEVNAILERTKKAFFTNFKDSAQDIKNDLAQDVALQPASKAIYDRAVGALRAVAGAHPAASEELKQVIYNLRLTFFNRLKNPPPEAQTPVLNALASLVEKLGTTEVALPALQWLNGLFLNTVNQAATTAPILEKAVAAKGSELALQLAELTSTAFKTPQPATVQQELAKLNDLDEKTALTVVLALRPILGRNSANTNPLVVKNAIELANGQNDLYQYLSGTTTRLQQFTDKLVQQNVLAKHLDAREHAALTLAAASAASQNVGAGPQNACEVITKIHQRFPRVNIPHLVPEDADGRPGIWQLTDPAVTWRHQPTARLNEILAIFARAPEPADHDVAARFALQLASIVGNLDGEYAIPCQRINQDLEAALKDPKKLQWLGQKNGAVAVRAEQQTALGFIAQHQDLPLELCFTAGLHLTADQIAWSEDRCKDARGRDTIRALRDMIFGAVTANKKEIIETLRTTGAPSKAISHTIHFIATKYRENKMGAIPWDDLIRGLNEGHDPIDAIEHQKTEETLKKLNLDGLIEKPDPAGLAEIARCAPAITSIMQHLVPNHRTDNVNCERLLPVFKEVLKAVAEGNWPSYKYDTEISQKNLACLTPAQQALWREESVTPLDGGEKMEINPKFTDAMNLTNGVVAWLKQNQGVLNRGELKDLVCDDASLARAEAALNEVIDALHNEPKEGKKRKALAKRAGQLRVPVALLRFVKAVESQGGDPKTALMNLRPSLKEAMPALLRIGRRDLHEAVAQADFAARTIRSSPKQGTYAADEDNLFGLITSTNTGGCVSYQGDRRFCNIGFAANAGDKLIRVYEEGKFVYRAVFKLLECKIGDYEGPILYLNNTAKGGGGNSAHNNLLIRHAISKAQAMGIPIATNQASGFAQVAQSMGLECKNQQVNFRFPDNASSTSFTNYAVNPTSQHGLQEVMGDKPYLEINKSSQLVMP